MTIPFISTDWLLDPVAVQVGPSSVALLLVLAARAAVNQPGSRSVVIAADEWTYYFDKSTTDRVVAVGLVEPIRVDGGLVALKVSSWVLSRVDDSRSFRLREQARDRMQRMRDRRRMQPKLDAWNAAATTADEERIGLHGDNDLHGRPGLLKACGETVDVTRVTSYANARRDIEPASAHAEVRTTSTLRVDPDHPEIVQIVLNRGNASSEKSDRSTFRLLLALVAHVRGSRRSWVAPTSSADRRDLVDAVRSAAERARLPTTDREIRRAIRYVDETTDDVVERPKTSSGDRS